MSSSSSLQDEYEDFFSGLGVVGTGFYKFINSFRIEIEDDKATIFFGKSAEDNELDVDFAARLRTWLKDQKRWIRDMKNKAPLSICKRRMWFLMSKFIDEGIFTTGELGKIMYYMDSTWELMSSTADESNLGKTIG
jgi:AAA+ ATPase superfamily predicted ATPase